MKRSWFGILLLPVIVITGCTRPAPLSAPYDQAFRVSVEESPSGGSTTNQGMGYATPAPENASIVPAVIPTPTAFIPPAPNPVSPYSFPTPNPPLPLPTPRSDAEIYMVEEGDTLAEIATRFGVSLKMVAEANPSVDPNLLYVGTALTIPAPKPGDNGPDFKIIPDSELVYGPYAAGFGVAGYVEAKNAYLAHYSEDVDGIRLTGAEIVNRVAHEYSVNPRLLLAVLEYRSGWVTRSNPAETTLDFPLGVHDAWRQGLYRQLAWAADNLNRGYYLWRAGGVGVWILADGTPVPVSPVINPGTAAVQALFAALDDRTNWMNDVTAPGLYETFQFLFGDPFYYTFEPLLPPGLAQPAFQLPFEPGDTWSFTGGPHGGWGSGSAWAAMDFAPPGEGQGCVLADAWVVAVVDGLIVRTGIGAVIQDLDGDGIEQTGWSILYMHIGEEGRIRPGTYVHAGERIGHPSCEGGVSNGTHTHIARRYNGEWIAADGPIPFNLDGWISSGDGAEYDGFLTRNEQILEAWDGRVETNQIQR